MAVNLADRALRAAPDRLRKMRIVDVARNDVPVEMGHDVAEAREIDLVRLQLLTQHRLYREHYVHEMRTLRFGKIGHFLHVCAPDHAAEPGIARLLDIDDAQPRVLPQ